MFEQQMNLTRTAHEIESKRIATYHLNMHVWETLSVEWDSFCLFQKTFKDIHEPGDFGSASIQAIFFYLL